MIFYVSDESEESISSTSWTQVASVSGVTNARSHKLFVNCEYAGQTKNGVVGIRVLIDGVEQAFDHFDPVLAGQYHTFCSFGIITFTVGEHTVSLEARCVNSSQTVLVRRKRLLVEQY